MRNKIMILITLVLLAGANLIYSQNTHIYENYSWEKNPVLSTLDKDTSHDAIVIFNKYIQEYYYDNNNTVALNELIHKKIKIVTNTGIERNNKVYIQVGDNDKILLEQARVIQNNGTIKELKKEDIKEGIDEESNNKYKYFAFEGVEVGCEIEYLYCLKTTPIFNGLIFRIQNSTPSLNTYYKFITPGNLFFKFKSYHNCGEFVKDTTIKDQNVWTLTMDSIKGVRKEDYSAYSSNVMSFAMKLDRNSYTGKKDLYSYGELVSRLYDVVYNKTDPKELKAIKSLIKTMPIDNSSEEMKIRSVENYIKTNFLYDDSDDPERSIITKIISNKAFNDFGSIFLFANIFKELNIEHELVLTSNRNSLKFDKDFEAYCFISDYLIYFPKTNKFMTPNDNFSRLGFFNSNNSYNYGLFFKGISMGDYYTGIGKIKYIDGAKYMDSQDNLNVEVELSANMLENKYLITREMTGYIAGNYQPFFDFVQEAEKIKEFSESILKYVDENGTVENLFLENNAAKYYGIKPLIAKGNLITSLFVEKAGNSFLLKVGLMIGPQLELYKTDERKFPLEFEVPHAYKRVISINIPKGFKVKNLEQLKMSEIYVNSKNDTTMAFISNYKTENENIKVEIREYYTDVFYTVKEYEEYRRVANAAANFNKIVLLFEKEN